jgi:hypothetical protein
MACEADCKIRKRKKIGLVGLVEVTAGPGNTETDLGKYPAKKDYDATLQAKINDWLADKVLAPKCASGCTCEATEEPDWDKKVVLTRTFQVDVVWNKLNWIVEATLQFKSAIVPGDCVEDPDKPIHLASAAIIPELGVTLLADGERKLTAEMVDKVRKALG